MERAKATYDRAIALASKALEANPQNATTMGSLTLYYARKGDSEQALKYSRRARSIDPKSLDLCLTAMEVETLTGHIHEAAIDLAEAFQKGLTRTLFVTDPELKALRNSPEFEPVWKQFADSKK